MLANYSERQFLLSFFRPHETCVSGATSLPRKEHCNVTATQFIPFFRRCSTVVKIGGKLFEVHAPSRFKMFHLRVEHQLTVDFSFGQRVVQRKGISEHTLVGSR